MKPILTMILMLLAFSGFSQTTTLDGSKSYDPDGSIVKYQWIKKSGPTSYTIQNPAAVITKVSDLVVGVYVFTLTVTDNRGATSSDDVQITVIAGNIGPKADAGPDQNVTLPGATSFVERASDQFFVFTQRVKDLKRMLIQ